MAGLFSRIKDSFRNVMLSPGAEDPYHGDYYDDDSYDDEYYDDHEDIQPQPPRYSQNTQRRSEATSGGRSSRSSLGNKVIELGYSANNEKSISESVIAHPTSINDAVEICSHVRSGRMVIVDLTSLDQVNAQRIADYLSGVCQSIDGDTKRVNNGIFTISPRNHRVTTDYREEMPTEGAFFPSIASSDR